MIKLYEKRKSQPNWKEVEYDMKISTKGRYGARAALEVAKRTGCREKFIVAMGCDTGERYLSTELFEG